MLTRFDRSLQTHQQPRAKLVWVWMSSGEFIAFPRFPRAFEHVYVFFKINCSVTFIKFPGIFHACATRKMGIYNERIFILWKSNFVTLTVHLVTREVSNIFPCRTHTQHSATFHRRILSRSFGQQSAFHRVSCTSWISVISSGPSSILFYVSSSHKTVTRSYCYLRTGRSPEARHRWSTDEGSGELLSWIFDEIERERSQTSNDIYFTRYFAWSHCVCTKWFSRRQEHSLLVLYFPSVYFTLPLAHTHTHTFFSALLSPIMWHSLHSFLRFAIILVYHLTHSFCLSHVFSKRSTNLHSSRVNRCTSGSSTIVYSFLKNY